MYWPTTADKSTRNRSTFNVSANVSADFLLRDAVDPERTNTTTDLALDFLTRRTDVTFFCVAGLDRAPLFLLFTIFSLLSFQYAKAQQNTKTVASSVTCMALG